MERLTAWIRAMKCFVVIKKNSFSYLIEDGNNVLSLLVNLQLNVCEKIVTIFE